MQWAQPEWHVVASDSKGNAIGHIGFDEFQIAVGGATISVVGIGGVVVRPEYQGQGIPAKLFDYLHRDAGNYVKAEAFTLFCPQRLVSYYQKHGYHLHEGECYFMQNEVSVLSNFQFMYRGKEIAQLVSRTGTIRIPSIPW